MSTTPRTDAKEFIGQAEFAEDNAPLLGCVEASFARQLESELEATQRGSASMRGALELASGLCDEMDSITWDEDSGWQVSSYSGIQDEINEALSADAGKGFVRRDVLEQLLKWIDVWNTPLQTESWAEIFARMRPLIEPLTPHGLVPPFKSFVKREVLEQCLDALEKTISEFEFALRILAESSGASKDISRKMASDNSTVKESKESLKSATAELEVGG